MFTTIIISVHFQVNPVFHDTAISSRFRFTNPDSDAHTVSHAQGQTTAKSLLMKSAYRAAQLPVAWRVFSTIIAAITSLFNTARDKVATREPRHPCNLKEVVKDQRSALTT